MSKWIDAEWIRNIYADFEHYENRDDWTTPIANVLAVIDDAPSIEIPQIPKGDVIGYKWVLEWTLKPLPHTQVPQTQ